MGLNVVVMGPPGAGKGTQADRFARERNVPKISTGDILRDAIRAQTALGKRAQAMMDEGNLVDDDTMVAIVRERLQQPDVQPGFLLDGFPRNLGQAQALDEILTECCTGPLIVVDIEVPEQELVRRLRHRLICKNCGTNAAPTTSMAGGRCTRCGGELVQRTDDSGEIVRTRLAVYRGQTQPLVEYYRRRPTFRIVNGAQAPQQVASDFAAAIADAASGAGPGGRSPARAEVGSHP